MSTPSVADQLSHLDALVRYHQLYWAHVVQEHPTPEMQAFLRDRWLPYFVAYTTSRQALGQDFVVAFIADEAHKLSELRELAASIAIPTPVLGSSQYGVVAPDPHPSVSGDPAEVGHWFLPLALGIPAGAAGGYYYRKWQDAHPGEIVPRLHLGDRLKTSTRSAGEIVGDLPWQTIIGQAIDVLRRQAKVAVDELPSRVIGVMRDGGNQWQLRQFRSTDDADDWFGHVTRQPSSFTYAAYYDKDDVMFPHPLNEAIGAARSSTVSIGADLSGPTEVRSPTSTSTEVRSPTSTSTEVRSPTSTSTDAYTQGNVTVTGGAGAGATVVHIHAPHPDQPVRADYESNLERSRGSAWRAERQMDATNAPRPVMPMPAIVDATNAPRATSPIPDMMHATNAPRAASPIPDMMHALSEDPVNGDVETNVGAWHSIVGSLPWDSVIGADGSDAERRHAWPQTKALIKSAIHEVRDVQNMYPDAEAYVWSLETASTYDPRPGVTIGPTTAIVPFSSREQALSHMRDRVQTDHVALALFDRTSPHWPNPVNWTKSDDPAHADVIAQQVARYTPTRTAGEIVGDARDALDAWYATTSSEDLSPHLGDVMKAVSGVSGEIVGDLPWWTIVGAEVDVFRRQAEAAAKEMPGRVVGIRRDARNQWQLESFSSVDGADNWFAVATAEPTLFTYAAYFDKSDPLFPHPLNEATGKRLAPASGVAVSGLWDSISNAVLTVTGTKMTNQFIQDHGLGGYVKMAATAVATAYGGPAAGAAASALAGPVMSLGVKDQAQATAAAQQVHGVTAMAQQHSPEMAQAVDVAHTAIKKTATTYHLAHLVKAARRGDPAAQQALANLSAAAAAGNADASAAMQLASMIDREQQATPGATDPSRY